MVVIKRLLSFFLLCLLLVPVIAAQEATTEQADKAAQETQKRKLLATKTYSLLDELIGELPTLRLPENRVRTEVTVAGLLWGKDPNRARNLFRLAINDLLGLLDTISRNDSESAEANQVVLDLRREIFQAVLNSDAKLALEFLQATKIPPALEPQWPKHNEMELEIQVAHAAAAKDPAVALAAAQASLANGLSGNLANTVSQLLQKDSNAAGKLAEDIAQKLGSEDFLSNYQASSLTMSILDLVNQHLLTSLQQTDRDANANRADAAPLPTLPDGTVRKLMEMLVRAALKGNFSITSNDPDERTVTIHIFTWLNSHTTLIEKYPPSRLQDLKKKLSQFQQISATPGSDRNLDQLSASASPEAIVSAAASAPAYQRNNLYFRASMKALNQGNLEQAVQIIEDQIKDANHRDQYMHNLAYHLINSGKMEQAQKFVESKILNSHLRNNLLMTIHFHKISEDLQKGKIEEAKALAYRLPLEQRLSKLVEIARTLIANGKKEAANQILESAWNTLPARAGNQEQLQAQLAMVSALASIDLAKATGYMQSIINQLNEMIRAVETLNGFDLRYYKDDELLMQNGLLVSLVQQSGYTLSTLAAIDFETAKILSEQFHRPETKLLARLAMITQLIQLLPSPSDDSVGQSLGDKIPLREKELRVAKGKEVRQVLHLPNFTSTY